MPDIRFDGEESYAPRPAPLQAKGLSGLIMRWGLAKNERSAQYVLLGIAALALVLALIVLLGSGAIDSSASLPPPPQ